MTVYFAGSGLDSFSVVGSGVTEVSCASSFPNILTQLNIQGNIASATTGQAVANFIGSNESQVSLSSYWCQIYMNVGSSASYPTTYPFGISFVAQDGSKIRFHSSNNSEYSLDIDITTSDGTVTTLQSGLYWNSGFTIYDFNIEGLGTKTGSISIYVNQVLYYSWSGDLSALGETIFVSIGALNRTDTLNLLSTIVQDTSTLGSYIIKQIASTAGSLTEWTGNFSNLTKNPYDSTSYVLASQAGLAETGVGNVPSFDTTLYYISGVTLTSLVLNPTSDINVSNFMIYNGTQYTVATQKQSGLYGNMSVMNTAPDGTEWSASNIKSIEFGIKTTAV